MEKDSLDLLFLLLVVILVIVLFVRIFLRVRKHGGSLTTTTFAATYEFFNKDKREAIEQIVEVKAHKKMEEQFKGKLFEEFKQKDLKKYFFFGVYLTTYQSRNNFFDEIEILSSQSGIFSFKFLDVNAEHLRKNDFISVKHNCPYKQCKLDR